MDVLRICLNEMCSSQNMVALWVKKYFTQSPQTCLSAGREAKNAKVKTPAASFAPLASLREIKPIF